MARKLNKAGDFRGGENSPGSFTSDNEQQKKAQAKSQTGEAKDKASASKAISTSPVVMNNGKKKRITPEVQQYIRDELTKTDRSGKTFLLSFIQNFLKEAKADPNSKAGMMLANSMFNDKLFTTLDEELLRGEKDNYGFQEYQIRQTLYDRQKEVFDNNIDHNFLIINSRRTGKTELAGRLIVRDLLRPITLENGIRVMNKVAYMNRSSTAAIHQIETPLKSALDACGLRCVKGSVADQYMKFENGAELLIVGNNNVADLNKLRGFHFNTLIMDECGHQRNVKILMQETIEATLMDYGKEARMYLIGTPPRTAGTYIEEVYKNATKRGWKLYHWTYQDNPYIMDRDTFLERQCEKYGVTADSPFIRREFFGEMGVYDSDAMIFKGYKTHNLTPEQIKTTVWDRCYISVDWGFNDHASIVVSLVSGKNMYVVWDWAKRGCATSDTMKMVKETYDKYNGELKLKRAPMVICDTNPKENVYELSKTYGLPAYSAYKHDKDMAIDQLACWLRTGTIQIPGIEESWLKHEAETTLWKRDPDTDKITHVIDDDFAHPDSMMALLYASRQFDNDVLMTGNSKGAKDILEAKPRKEYYDEEGYDYEVI